MNNEVAEFPVWGLLPKKETGVTSFLTKYPAYDGRGVTIAIFDSGVDPGAPGMQLTSEGKTKVIERYDCSGCGDVDTSTIKSPNAEGIIIGLTGRKLKIPKDWYCENNQYHLGVKNAYELFPSKLKGRIETERKEKYWDAEQKIASAEATRKLQKFECQCGKKDDKELSEMDNLIKEDLEARIEYLNNTDKKYNDLGPVYDCIVFFDGEMWQACIDTTEKGCLRKVPLLGEYSKTHKYIVLSETDQLNISINVHDDGNILEIVGLCSSHGTHVASIASAYFPDNPEKNGVAPGAQIISLTIGDGRLTSMETGSAVIRAMILVMELSKKTPIHVINMSYGEHANWSNTGRIGELMNDVVNKYGVVWVASAGNHGPALSTIGTPPDISQNTIIGVGAYVSPEMMVAEYSLRHKLPGMTFTWTSRGPTIDGGMGVSICAPGAAITSVPNYTLRNSQLLNGTSMSAPHVAGAVAILISGLLKKELPYSPYSIKRALENSAKSIPDVERFAQGYGLLQVEDAFSNLINYFDCSAKDVRFSISCGSAGTKGVLLRSTQLNHAVLYNICVDPVFRDCDDVTAESKIAFNLHLALLTRESFVQIPKYLELQNQERSFSIRVDPTHLLPGVHYSFIDGYDTACPEKGPMFRIPITVIQPFVFHPDAVPYVHWENKLFKPNTIRRHFILVPDYASWGVLKLRCNKAGQQSCFFIHCMQLLPKRSCRCQEYQKIVTITSQSDTILNFQVKGGIIMELVIAKYWANLDEIETNYSLCLYGVKPENPSIVMQAADGICSVDVRTLRSEEILPAVNLKTCVQILKPNEAKVSPLARRDLIPKGRQIYELILSYDFHLSKSAEVTPNSPILSEVLYESEFESQLWLLFDSNKQMLAAGDAYPSKYSVKIERGDYVIKLQVRHEKKDLLDKLVDIPMLLNRKLANAISLEVYSSYSQAVIQGKKMTAVSGSRGTSVPVYISPYVEKSKLSALQCNYLIGNITYCKDELGKKVDIHPFKFIPLDYVKKSSKTDKETSKSKTEEYSEALRDLKTTFLTKLDVREQAAEIYEELKSSFPDYLAAHTAMIQSIEPCEPKKLLPVIAEYEIRDINHSTCKDVIEIANNIINVIDEEKLLVTIAIKNDPRGEAAKVRSAIEKQRTALLEAYSRKGIALCRLYLIERTLPNSETVDMTLEDITNIWKNILKFVDPSEQKITSTPVIYFFIWHGRILEQYGRMLKYLTKLNEEKPTKEIEEKISEICDKCEWKHIARYVRDSILIKYPASYRPF